ncbi:MAG: CBS domain-containing protein [Gemmatimonadota bacterium]|nr:CBS domain-containing protein [Gemmatimonadota bacterium]MDH3421502.1 CBS domain-containing protein [Gemmatimonadota bacterium]
MTSTGSNPCSVPSTAADIMRTPVVTVSSTASLRELLNLLRRTGVSGVPVVGMDQKVIGTVSVTDLMWCSDRLAAEDADVDDSARAVRHLDETTVREVMTPDVFGVGPQASLAEVAAFFASTGLGRAVVLDSGELVGIVSVVDLLALFADRTSDAGAG